MFKFDFKKHTNTATVVQESLERPVDLCSRALFQVREYGRYLENRKGIDLTNETATQETGLCLAGINDLC